MDSTNGSFAGASALRQGLTSPRLLLLSFLLLIAAGTVGFMTLPGLYTGDDLSWLDALFTATSAVCVTGLIVVDTGTYFTVWGQAFVLFLVQVGGLGILTFATLLLLSVGRRLSLHHETLSAEMLEVVPDLNVKRMVKNLLLFTLAVEGIGTVLLFVAWMHRFPPGTALWNSVFHAVSAFCNAGFSTFSDSLTGFSRSPLTLGVVSILIVVGGIGFLTVEEIRRVRKKGHARWWRHLGLHSRLALTVTAILVIGGAALFLGLEWSNTLAELSPLDRIANGLFMSVTARTAGFNTVDYGATADSTNFLTILLMSIGGSPGSTAGGLKTTTIAIIGLVALARLKGEQVPSAWGRSVSEETVHRAVGLSAIMFVTTTAGLLLMTVLDGRLVADTALYGGFLGQMFEVVSAFNTVGLSMGQTAGLHGGAKTVTIILMYLGRVGPLSVAAALARDRKHGKNVFRYSYDSVMIG